MQDVMLSQDSRRKIAVHVTGGTNAKSLQDADAAAATTSQAAATAVPAADSEAQAGDKVSKSATEDDVDMQPAKEDVQLIEEVWTFKRAQMLYPSVK